MILLIAFSISLTIWIALLLIKAQATKAVWAQFLWILLLFAVPAFFLLQLCAIYIYWDYFDNFQELVTGSPKLLLDNFRLLGYNQNIFLTAAFCFGIAIYSCVLKLFFNDVPNATLETVAKLKKNLDEVVKQNTDQIERRVAEREKAAIEKLNEAAQKKNQAEALIKEADLKIRKAEETRDDVLIRNCFLNQSNLKLKGLNRRLHIKSRLYDELKQSLIQKNQKNAEGLRNWEKRTKARLKSEAKDNSQEKENVT